MVLVTGHRGYIGTHLMGILADQSSHGTTNIFRHIENNIETCDLKDGQDYHTIRGRKFDVVIHLAASVSVTDSFNHPLECMYNNATGLGLFLRDNIVDRLVFVSTGGAMYGNALMAREQDALWTKCMSPYAQSKFVGEMIVKDLCPNHAILRLANVYGGDYSVRGEAAVHAHFATDDPITLYGGQQTRDFIGVDKVCTAILHAAHGTMQGAFNIGSGVATRISDLAHEYSLMRKVHIDYQPSRPGEVDYITLDISRATKAGLL